MPAATVIRERDAVGHVWGDVGAGEVADAWYASTDAVHMLVYSMAPRESVASTDDVRTVFDADQLYYVLAGTLALANPATGEVRVVETGEAAHVGTGTWTHGVACGDGAVRVLELVSPGLESAAALAYTASQPTLRAFRYSRPELHGRWPLGRRAERTATIRVLREQDVLWRLDGADRVRTGVWLSTGRATVETLTLCPGQRTDLVRTPAETCVYALEGRLGVRLPEGDDVPWLELGPGDGLHLAPAALHRLQSFGSAPTRALRLVAA